MALKALGGRAFDTSLSVTTAVPAAVVQPRGGTVVETQRQNVARRRTAPTRLGKRLALRLNAKQRALMSLERATFADARVRRVVAISGYVARQLATHHGVPAERTVVIPNAAVSPSSAALQNSGGWERLRRAERERLGVGPDDVAFLFAALNPGLKGWPTLRAALRRVVAATNPSVPNGPRPVALLAGAFGDLDRRSVDAQGLGPATRVLGRCDNLAPAYAAADVVVLPTWYDPCSKVVLEGLMARRPAVTTRFNGAADWLTPADGPARGIVLADPGDAEALADAVTRLTDPATRAAMTGACAGMEDALDMERHVDALEEVLREAGA